MSLCVACRHSNRDGARFCEQCGQPLERRCSNCGHTLGSAAKFCDQCGTPAPVPGSGAVPTAQAMSAAEQLADSAPSASAPADPVPPASRGIGVSPHAVRLSVDEGERRHLTVMFCDLVGSTQLSQRLDPEDLREIVRGFQDVCSTAVAKMDGFVARYLGDGMMVYFGYPLAHEDDAERAVAAGLAVVEGVCNFRSPVCDANGIELSVRVGIATGLVIAGDIIGEGASEERAVLGQTPNLAARLQSLAAPNEVLIGASTLRLVSRVVETEPRGEHMLKGFAEPVAVARAVEFKSTETRFDALRDGEHLTILTGREDELATLARRVEMAVDGEGQVVLICGEPGIGKSRLAQHVTDSVDVPGDGDRRRCRVFRFQCSAHHASTPLYPIKRNLLRALRDTGRGDDTAEYTNDEMVVRLGHYLVALGMTSPEDAALIGAAIDLDVTPPALSTPMLKSRTLHALARLLERNAAKKPLVVVFEDVQWLDPTTHELLDIVVGRITEMPIALLVTLRPEQAPPWVGLPGVTMLNVSRLSPRQGAQMVTRVAGDQALGSDSVRRIVEKTDGVPLFIEELTRLVLESDTGEVSDNTQLVGFSPEIPSTLHDSLTARLDRLGDAKEVAQVGSIIGREFSAALLRAVAPQDETELLSLLPKLGELLHRRGAQTSEQFVFKQALVQEVAYSSVLNSKRQHYHAKVAECLLGQFSELAEGQPELVAHHFQEAGRPGDAAGWWLRAGQRAVARAANVEAIAHLELAREGCRRATGLAGNAALELEILTALGPALFATRGYAAPEVEAVYARAAVLCEAMQDQAALLPVQWGRWAFHLVRADLAEALSVSEAMLITADAQREPSAQIEACVTVGLTRFFLGDLDTAIAHLERLPSLDSPERDRSFTQLSGQDAVVCGLVYWGLALACSGDGDGARERAREARELALELDHPFSQTYAANFSAWVGYILRDVDMAERHARESIALSKRHGFFWSTLSSVILGWTTAVRGEPAEGLEMAEAGYGDYRASGARLSESLQLGVIAEIAAPAGNTARAEDALNLALAATDVTGEQFWRDALERQRTASAASRRANAGGS